MPTAALSGGSVVEQVTFIQVPFILNFIDGAIAQWELPAQIRTAEQTNWPEQQILKHQRRTAKPLWKRLWCCRFLK